MTKEMSLYLDIVRFLAAMTVFLGHVAGSRFTGGFLWQLTPFMGEAVTIFFVLSGFVIGYATDRREGTPGLYAVARAARICSVAFPALAVTFILDGLGRAMRPELYSAVWGYQANGQIWQFLSGLFFANQIWFVDVPQGSDLPYWSLGFEVWYYFMFGLAMFAPKRWRSAAIAATLVFVGPRVAILFPLWLIGLACYRLNARRTVGVAWGAMLYVVSSALWIGWEMYSWHHGRLEAWVPAALNRPELIQDYLISLLFAGQLIGFRAIGPLFGPVLASIARPVRWLAGATFTVYLFHLPVAQFLATLVPWAPSAWPTRVAIVGGTLVCLFLIAEATERRKEPWRRMFAALLNRFSPPRADAPGVVR